MSERRKRIPALKIFGLVVLAVVACYFVALRVKGASFEKLETEWSLAVEQLVDDRATWDQVIVEFQTRGVEPSTWDAVPGLDEKARVWTQIDKALTIWPYDQSLAPIVYFDDQGIAESFEVRILYFGIKEP